VKRPLKNKSFLSTAKRWLFINSYRVVVTLKIKFETVYRAILRFSKAPFVPICSLKVLGILYLFQSPFSRRITINVFFSLSTVIVVMIIIIGAVLFFTSLTGANKGEYVDRGFYFQKVHEEDFVNGLVGLCKRWISSSSLICTKNSSNITTVRLCMCYEDTSAAELLSYVLCHFSKEFRHM